MSTTPEVIMQFLDGLIDTATDPAIPVWRSRVRPIPEGKDKAVVIRPLFVSQPDRIVLGKFRWIFTVGVEVYARGDVPDAIADPVIKAIAAALAANATLSGLVDDVVPGSRDWEFESRDTDLVAAGIQFQIEFTTSEATL